MNTKEIDLLLLAPKAFYRLLLQTANNPGVHYTDCKASSLVQTQGKYPAL